MTTQTSRWGSPRRDPSALAFGIAFVLLGVAGLLREGGVNINAHALAQIALIAIGIAGLTTLLVSGRRQRS